MKTLHDILKQAESMRFATDCGTDMHRKLQRVIVSSDFTAGDSGLVQRIITRPDLIPFFCDAAQTEVPIAGTANGRFISRRVDRLVVNKQNKTVLVLDYKTDRDSSVCRDKYVAQIKEYIDLLRAVYPEYVISGYILWTYDFSLEKIHTK